MFRNSKGDVTILFAILAIGLMYAATLFEYNQGGSGGGAVDTSPVRFIAVKAVDPESGFLGGSSGKKVIEVSLKNDGGTHEDILLEFEHSPRTAVVSDELEKETEDVNGTVLERFALPTIYSSEKEVAYTPFALNKTVDPSVTVRKEEISVRLVSDEGEVYDSAVLVI